MPADDTIPFPDCLIDVAALTSIQFSSDSNLQWQVVIGAIEAGRMKITSRAFRKLKQVDPETHERLRGYNGFVVTATNQEAEWDYQYESQVLEEHADHRSLSRINTMSALSTLSAAKRMDHAVVTGEVTGRKGKLPDLCDRKSIPFYSVEDFCAQFGPT